MNDCFWSPISYSPTSQDDLSPGSGMIVIPRNWTASFHGAKDFTWGLGVTDPRALLRVTTGWGWNKSFNDNVTLLLDSSIDQLIKNSLFISLKGCSEKNNACNKQSSSNGSCKLYWFTTFDVTKDTETGRHSLTVHWPSYLLHEFTPIQQTAVEVIYPLLCLQGFIMFSYIPTWCHEK